MNAIVYDSGIARDLKNQFFDDLKDAEKIDVSGWKSRPWYKLLTEQAARLISPLM